MVLLADQSLKRCTRRALVGDGLFEINLRNCDETKGEVLVLRVSAGLKGRRRVYFCSLCSSNWHVPVVDNSSPRLKFIKIKTCLPGDEAN